MTLTLQTLSTRLEGELYTHITPKEPVSLTLLQPCLMLIRITVGGGHAPDIIVVCGQNDVLPSSTNPTRPYAKNTLDEHLDVSLIQLYYLKIQLY